MIGTVLLVTFLEAVAFSGEQVSLRCAAAVHSVVEFQRARERASGEIVTDADFASRYPAARCVQSRKEPERRFVSLSNANPFLRIHRVFVVDPSGAIRVERSMPCDEIPDPQACK